MVADPLIDILKRQHKVVGKTSHDSVAKGDIDAWRRDVPKTIGEKAPCKISWSCAEITPRETSGRGIDVVIERSLFLPWLGDINLAVIAVGPQVGAI